MSRTASARTLIVSLFGAFVRGLGGWIAVGDMVELLGALGVDGQVARSAIARMKQSGQLVAERRGGRAGYRPSDELGDVLAVGDSRLFSNTAGASLADGWLVVIFSVPEAERDQRHVLRSRLGALGCGPLAPGVFVAPRRVEADVRRMLSSVGLERYVSMFGGEYLGFADLAVLVRSAWDLSAAKRYQRFVRVHPVPSHVPEPVAAFVSYVRLLEDWRQLVYEDPGLPDELTPHAGARRDAAVRFAACRGVLAGPAVAYVQDVIGDR